MKALEGKGAIRYFTAFIVVILFLLLHEAYVTRAHPDAPYMDTLRLVYQLEQWLSGGMSFYDFWSQGGQHQGFIFQIILLANVKFYSLDIMFANRVTGVAVAIFIAATLFSFLSAAKRHDGTLFVTSVWVQIGICVLFSVICFSWAGFELFTLDLGLPLWLKNISFLAYFVLYAWYVRADPGYRSTWFVGFGLAIIGPAIVLVMAMGWSYSFVASMVLVSVTALIKLSKQDGWRKQFPKCIPLIALVIAQLVYVVTSIGGARSANHSSYSSLIQVPDLLLYALGSSVIGLETIQSLQISLHIPELIGAGMLVSAIVLVIDLLRHRDNMSLGSLVPLYLLAYGFFTALSVSVARGHGGPTEVMASRYYMDIMLFILGLVWVWYENLAMTEAKRASVSTFGFLVLCLTIFAGQGLTYVREWGAAPYRAMAFKAMNKALLEGVPDQAAANLLQSPFDNARLGDQALREHHLALYSSLRGDSCELARVELKDGWYTHESQGIWMGKEASILIPECRCDFVAKIYLPSDFPARTLNIQDAASSRAIDLAPGKVEKISFGSAIAPRVVGLSVSVTTTPAKMSSASRDVRSLGVDLTDYGFACGANSASKFAR